jgi:aspartate aminotransferase-like enzyme
VRPEILREMTRPMVGHRSAGSGTVPENRRRSKPLFGTQRDTFVATCSGTGLMQAAL